MNDLCRILRLYSDLQIPSSIIFEEVAFELEMRFDQLNKDGSVNALVAMKLAPTDKIKSIRHELESLMVENIEIMNLEDLA